MRLALLLATTAAPALAYQAGAAPAPRATKSAPRMAAAGDVPSIIVGGGRIGSLLKDIGVPGDVVRREEEVRAGTADARRRESAVSSP